ncbi:MAG: CHAT domain-containing protein [Alphaproteobacteria bacterium]|nr:CHAT domain-containing protein [Alphaproteobacteria bacterium]
MRISYRAGELTLSVDGAPTKRRAHSDDDHGRLEELAGKYGHMVEIGQFADLEGLGRDIHDWLNGEQKDWLASFESGNGPRPIELAIEDGNLDDPIGRAFLDVPWEVMANEAGFLAGDAERPLVVSRRIGAATTPPTPSHSDVLLMFMAAQPDNRDDLEIDREEAGILEATARLPLHLRVEESGCLEFLGPRMALEAPIEALHLSCHGAISNGKPVLLLEDAKGQRSLTAPAELVRSLGEAKPPLIFLSACRTAEQEAASPSLAMRMIRSGVANVIGWDGSVYDISASSFARVLYGELGRCQTVPYAAAMARLALLQTWRADPRAVEGRHWHLAWVYLGEAGGGPIAVAGERKRQLPKNAGFQEFLDKERAQSPVASARTFVGRRRKVQEVLRAFDDQAVCGVLIHGMGRLGKSSLAARIANRMPEHKPVVIFKNYHADQLWDRVLAALPPRTGQELRRTWDAASIAETFELALKDALESRGGAPLLLIIDDLEQILEDPEPGRDVLVQPAHRAMLGAVLRAFGDTDNESRLLLTSRYRFILKDDAGDDLAAGLHDLPLPEMSATERQRQLRAERELQEEKAKTAETDDDR